MKLTGILSAYCVCCAVALSAYADADFDKASKLLTAAKNANIQQVQSLISSGANVNYVDPTGLSLVCTALMNNDTRAFQILQMYGADASQCDIQIKQYKNRTTVKGSNGVFGGLSTPQTLTLAAGGAALVGGGVALLTGVFNPSNDNGNAGGGSRPDSGGGSGGGGDNLKPEFTIPYGPAMPTSEVNYTTGLDYYSNGIPPEGGPVNEAVKANFEFMSKEDEFKQNYLLMMHGYSPFARGYLGQNTLRNPDTNAPIPASEIGQYSIGSGLYIVDGGRPINVALVTANGINAANKPVDKLYTAEINALDDKLMAWMGMSGTQLDPTIQYEINLTNKYYNNEIVWGGQGKEITGAYTREAESLLSTFDLSNSGSVVNNESATFEDDLLAKIVGGSLSGFSGDDYTGFMPNGQMSIFRTGNGKGFVDGELASIDYMNYSALLNAAKLNPEEKKETKKNSKPDVIANLAIVPKLYLTNARTVADILSVSAGDDRQKTFFDYINLAYDVNDNDGIDGTNSLPSTDAYKFFNGFGVSYSPFAIFSTGAYETGSDYQGAVQKAGFENAAPLVFPQLDHLFMSIVAVGLTGTGTSEASSISGFNPTGKYTLSKWHVGTGDAAKYYVSRIYGYDDTMVSAAKTSGVDPWGFAAAGVTAEQATAAAAGAVGALKSAFSYMDNKQLFTLLALTADGPYLGTNENGVAYSKDTLASYLQNMFELPTEYDFSNISSEEYLKGFKTVYGYGLINLERATTPGKSIYYYDPNKKKIVAGNGTAYWRAAIDTSFNLTGPFGARGATMSAPFYDVLTSVDGEMSLPRVWENEISLGSDSVHALYMGDVLGDLKTRKDSARKTKIGNMSLSMTISERPYADNLGGLDNLGFAYENDKFNLSADFQRYFTDGQSRFTGMANPILALTADTISTGAEYKIGNFFVGGRAFSGAITDEAFLQNDPTVSSQYQSLRLGVAQGAMSNIGWNTDKFSFVGSVGFLHESDTILGAQTNGLFNIGNGDTTYIDMLARYDVTDNVSLSLRSTFAQTKTNPTGMFINDVSDLNSNAFAFGANLGNFEFTVSRPLAIRSGALRYAYANYDIIDNGNGKYDLAVSGAGLRDLSLAPDVRETRFSGTYRHSFGEFTDGALGFIYRVNPNNTNRFGNESIFMLKLTHRLGI